MSQINKYTDDAAYTADTARSKNKSSVSMIGTDLRLVHEGVNVVVERDSAGVGDLVVWDATAGRIRFVKQRTLVKSLLPATLTPLAVVYFEEAHQIGILSLSNTASVCWAAPYEVALGGFDLVNGGSFVLHMNTGSAAADTTFTYPAGATLANIVTVIAAGLPNYNKADYGGWTASVWNNEIIMTSNTWSAARAVIDVVSGCTIRRTAEDKHYQTTLAGLIEGSTEYVRRNNQVTSYLAGINLPKFAQYYGANASAATANVALGSDKIVNRTDFTSSDFCAALRARYATYEDYLQGEHMLQWPSGYGSVIRDGKTNSNKISGLTFTDIRGNVVPCYPAAALGASFGVTVAGAITGLEAGGWWMPSVREARMMMNDRPYDATGLSGDPVNLSLVAVGGAPIYGSGFYTWLVCEYYSYYAFCVLGSNGDVYGSFKCNSLPVRLVSALWR